MPSSFISVGISTSAAPPGEPLDGSFVLTFPLNTSFVTGHYGIPKASTGRNGQVIVAIVLHVLETPIDTYMGYLNTALALADVRPGEHGSVHYGIEAGGAIHRFVADSNTAWAIQELNNPTWTLLNDHVGVDPNFYTLNIGVEQYISANMPTTMFRALADLVTYLCLLYDIPIDVAHIIDHAQLDDTYDDCAEALATNLIATVTSLAAQGNQNVSLDVGVMAAQLAALQTQVDTLEDEFADSLATISTYAAHVTTNATTSVLGHVKSSSTIAATAGVVSAKTLAASHKVNPDSPQSVVASIAAIVQYPTVIQDANAWATLGGNWRYIIGVAGLYRMRARVQFAAATWTAGKYIQLDVFKNGVLHETIAYRVIEANLTSKIVEIAGEATFVVSTLTDFWQVKVITDDANGAKSIVGGAVAVEKVGA